ncbi:MAG TPA: MATE family efflux transporter [Candidatus Melainabacteria bacterium]|nr:MATE family efflux transporter [Candidatus Melainabacteria bacterium]
MATAPIDSPENHSFVKRPNRTIITLATPVLFSMIAEPLTGLVDTSFISRLGAEALAALGVGTVILSGTFWIFNFLGVGSQTEIAQLWGRQDKSRASQIAGMALAMALVFGICISCIGFFLADRAATLMGAEADSEILTNAVDYMRVRFFAAPAILLTLTSFGILRGLQDMKTPMKVAILVNVVNVILDPIFIFGYGVFPALGIKGAALSTLISQYIGASLCLYSIKLRFPLPEKLKKEDIKGLIKIGGDLFIRTGLLTLFILLCTREATRAGAESGAAHQAIRQIWLFTALFLDSFAITGQSLIGYFLGAGKIDLARKVALYIFCWSVLTGVLLCGTMLASTNIVVKLLVPASALTLFESAWVVAAVAQPINALAFATDGIHWGTGDFGFLRNVMILATGTGALLLLGMANAGITIGDGLTTIWTVTAVWISVRAVFGVTRVFPGFGAAPLKECTQTN